MTTTTTTSLLLLACCLLLACTVSATDQHKKIIGGRIITRSQRPFQVAVINLNKGGLCGGSIIGPNHVLTAAHCVRELTRSGPPLDSTSIRVDITDDVSSSPQGGSQTASRVLVHSSYTGNPTSANTFVTQIDLCILEFSTPFDLDGVIAKAVVLPNANDRSLETPGTTATVSGFGNTQSTSQGGSGAGGPLRAVDLPVVSDSVCDAASKANGLLLREKTVCAGGVAGKDSCQGDSGGPLTASDMGTDVLIGVVSSGTKTTEPLCAEANEYGTYVSVAENRVWIDQVMAGNYQDATIVGGSPTSVLFSAALIAATLVALLFFM